MTRAAASDMMFKKVKRQQFREYFQPSRVALGIIEAPTQSGVNVITLCFNMHCSYKPSMMAFAVQEGSYSHHLLQEAKECVLAVPGEQLASQALYCGLNTGRNRDKVAECGFTLVPGQTVRVPGIEQCIANIEMQIVDQIVTGNHVTVLGEVKAFQVDRSKRQKSLLSVGREHAGYKVLARHGIHRLGVVQDK